MKRILARIFLVFSLLFSCSALTGCDEWNLSQSHVELFMFSCNAINQYTNEAGNKLSASIGKGAPLKCTKDVANKYKFNLVISDIKAASIDGPLYYSIAFKAPLAQSSKKVYTIAAMIAFELKDRNNYRALSEYIFCTEHNENRMNGGRCLPYTYSNKNAYTPVDVKEVIVTGNYSRNKNSSVTPQAVISPSPFGFTTSHIKLAANANVGGIKASSSGIVKISIKSTFTDEYAPDAEKAISLCTDGLSVLFDARSTGGLPFTYNNVASQLFVSYGFVPEDADATDFANYEFKYTIDEDWISSNADADMYHETEETAESTKTSEAAVCRFGLSRTVGTMQINKRGNQLIIVRINNLEDKTYSWYIVGKFITDAQGNIKLIDDNNSNYWKEDTGFEEGTGTIIDNTNDDQRCPAGEGCAIKDYGAISS